MVDALPQLAVDDSLGVNPTNEEFTNARCKLRHNASGLSGLSAVAFKCIDGISEQLLFKVLVKEWDKESSPRSLTLEFLRF